MWCLLVFLFFFRSCRFSSPALPPPSCPRSTSPAPPSRYFSPTAARGRAPRHRGCRPRSRGRPPCGASSFFSPPLLANPVTSPFAPSRRRRLLPLAPDRPCRLLPRAPARPRRLLPAAPARLRLLATAPPATADVALLLAVLTATAGVVIPAALIPILSASAWVTVFGPSTGRFRQTGFGGRRPQVFGGGPGCLGRAPHHRGCPGNWG